MSEIDRLVGSTTPAELSQEMERLKSEVDQVNMSTVCDKRELNLNVIGPKLRYVQLAHMLVTDTLRAAGRRLATARQLEPIYVPPNS